MTTLICMFEAQHGYYVIFPTHLHFGAVIRAVCCLRFVLQDYSCWGHHNFHKWEVLCCHGDHMQLAAESWACISLRSLVVNCFHLYPCISRCASQTFNFKVLHFRCVTHLEITISQETHRWIHHISPKCSFSLVEMGLWYFLNMLFLFPVEWKPCWEEAAEMELRFLFSYMDIKQKHIYIVAILGGFKARPQVTISVKRCKIRSQSQQTEWKNTLQWYPHKMCNTTKFRFRFRSFSIILSITEFISTVTV